MMAQFGILGEGFHRIMAGADLLHIGQRRRQASRQHARAAGRDGAINTGQQ